METSTATPRLTVQSLAKSYGSGPAAAHIIGDLTFSTEAGEIMCIVGPSGVGKTTLLKCLAGLHPSTGGTISIDGRAISGPPPEMALVFQDYSRSLMPWLTVRKNLVLPLRHLRLDPAELKDRCDTALAAVGLAGADAQVPVAALRRHAAARGDRPRAGLPPGDPDHGRAVRLGRRADPLRARGPAA